jgi:hypothetical protein
MVQRNYLLDRTVNDMSECPKENIRGCMVMLAKDWGLDNRNAWLWGIVLGWDAESLAELKIRHDWTDDDVALLQRLHRRWRANDIQVICAKCGEIQVGHGHEGL